jgi:selenophosphate synthase
VRKIVVKNSRELLITTSFGTLILSTVEQKAVFNPYNLSPMLRPQMIPELIQNKDYTSALLIALKLNINARKLLTKIPA